MWKKDNLKSKLLLSAKPESPEALRRHGLSIFNEGKGNLLEAGQILESAARKNIQGPGFFWYALGECRYALWESTWDEFVDEDGDGVDDRLEEVVGAYRRGLAFPEMLVAPKIFLSTGLAYESYGSFDGAMQMYSHVISGFPNYKNLSTVILRAAAVCRHPRVNALDKATQYFEYLLDNPPPPYTPAKIQFILAGCYQRQGRNNLARDMFTDVLKKDFEEKRKEKAAAKKLNTDPAQALLSGLRPTPTKSSRLPNIQVWMSDPNMWREHASFHFKAGYFTLAVDDMSQCLRVSGNEAAPVKSNGLEWKDWELLALSLGRINERESALKALERAYNLNPYAEPIRLRQRIARWDPIEWGVRIEKEEKIATKITSFYRGRTGAWKGHAMMKRERERRAVRNNAATSIQCAYRFQRFRRKLRRDRALIQRSLGWIRKRRLQSTFESWKEFLELVLFHRAKRNRAQYSVKLWFFYEKSRDIRKKRRAHNRNVVAKCLENIKNKTKRKFFKGWERYVVWIIEVKEPYNATTIECWYKHLKWAKEFHRKRQLMLQMLDQIRLNFARRLFHHFTQVVSYQIKVRHSRRVTRPYDRYSKCFAAWKYWTHEFRPWWEEQKEERLKERYYIIKRAAYRLVGSDNSLRTDPRPLFSVLGLASIGVAMAGGRDSTLDTTSTEAKLIRLDRYPHVTRQLRRSLTMYDKVCRLWREFYANREESQGVSFMHSRLPKDSFDRANLGSIYYKGIVQTALIKQELDRFRLFKVPINSKLRPVLPGPRHKKPKTTMGTLYDREKYELETHFVQIHKQAMAEKGQKFMMPPSMGIMALTLPNSLRKQVKNFKPPGRMSSLKMSRLTGKNMNISKWNLAMPQDDKDEIIVDRREEDEDDEDDEDENGSGGAVDYTVDEFGNDDPEAILKRIMEQAGAFPEPVISSNRHAWGFPEYVRPGVYGVEGAEKVRGAAEYDIRIGKSEWARMAREEIEQREIDAKRLRIFKEEDYKRFAASALVCGPMTEMDFFCATRPGRMFSQRAYVSACRIQLWALIWVPRRYSNRLEASIHIQRACRGRLARHLLETKLKIKRNIRKMIMRLRDSAFRQWYQLWSGKKKAQRMMMRLLHQNVARCYDQWCNYIRLLQESRLKKLKDAYVKMLNAKLYRHFVTWYDYIPLAKKIRRLMWKVMASNQMYFFDLWANNVEDIMEDRKELKASIQIQQTFRGLLGKNRWKNKYKKYTTVAKLLQRMSRGMVGRVKAKLYRKRRHDEDVRAAREAKIREARGSYNDRIDKEKTRRFMENMFVEDATRSAEIARDVKLKRKLRQETMQKIKKLANKIELFGKQNGIQLEAIKHGAHHGVRNAMKGVPPVPIKYMTWPLLSSKQRKAVAERWVRSTNRSHAAMFALSKFRFDRPPPFSCVRCLETFVEERDLNHHTVCHLEKSHHIFTPEALYEFGFAESGGAIKEKRNKRERRDSSYIGSNKK